MMLSTPANAACNQVYWTLSETERNTLERFFLSDDQIPARYAERHSMTVDELLTIIDDAGRALFFALFGFDP